MLRIIALTLACLITSACRRDRPCGDLELDAVRNACVCPGGAAWDVDAGRCGSDAGTLATVDAGEDAGPEDGGCGAPLGTVDNCTACDDRCGWSCEGVTEGCNDAVAIGAGWDHTCAVRESGEVWCWGWNPWAALGVEGPVLEPSLVADVPEAIDVDGARYVSSQHTCAVTRAGLVFCWGTNMYGELGDGTTEERADPVEAYGVRGATQIATADARSCAVADGNVYCWGGLGAQALPEHVRGLPTGVTDVDVRTDSACAIASGGAWCWGWNSDGQLGDGTTLERSGPVQPLGLSSNVTAVSLGRSHACAVAAEGLYCWGGNDSGQLGTGNTASTLAPIRVDLPGPVRDVDAGSEHTCALLTDDSLYCWGANEEGQVGDESTANRLAPVRIPGVAGRSLALGRQHSCVIGIDGAVRCWGVNTDGQVGDGTTFRRTAPTAVATD